MLSLKLAYLNLKGAGLRTWLNVVVLSMSYVLIIWTQGLYKGMNEQVSRAMIDEEIGGGQYWQEIYDPYDPLSLDDSHAAIPDHLSALAERGEAVPILVRQAVIYPEGRIRNVILKGIDPGQTILDIPTKSLDTEEDILPLLIGKRMAKSTSFKTGDYMTIRWRDVNGTFDAIEGKIVRVMDTMVQSIDNGQIWLPLKELENMARLKGEATLVVVKKGSTGHEDLKGFIFKDHSFLLKDIHQMVRVKSVSASIMYLILLSLAMIAIFDTQILSVFRRRKEIGTMVALGMTRKRVVAIFTFEGAMHGLLAFGFAAVYGIPLLIYTHFYGLKLPEATEDFGFALSDRLFPVYGLGLIIGTVLIIMVAVTVVSYLPSSKISSLKPTDAIKGKIS
jgi:ABC-type lipoprotein release transport system permease subunit